MRLPRRGVLRAQAAYYAATAVWPLVHMRSFEFVSGPKTDRWLVRTVGLLLGATAASLWAGAPEERLSSSVLAAGAAASLAAIDVVYVARRRIRPVYLLDAAAEAAILAGLALATPRGSRSA